MSGTRRIVDEYIIEAYYHPSVGWELVAIEETFDNVKAAIKIWREKEDYPFRICKRKATRPEISG